MLKDRLSMRIFIRSSILALRAVAPVSIGYCVCRAAGWSWTDNRILGSLVDGYAAAESVFFLLVYLPRKWFLSRPAPPSTPLPTPAQRKSLFLKTWEATSDPRGYLSGWFKGAPVEELHREDVKDFFSWRMWNDQTERVGEDEAELSEYVAIAEDILQCKFPPGRSDKTCMAVTYEPLRMRHRPLIWYLLFVGAVDLQFTVSMWIYRYRHYTPSLRHSLLTLPPRPLTLLGSRRSPATHLSYWSTPHTSTEHLPILFLHAIGVGLQFYLPFFAEFKATLKKRGIGIIAIELLPVSSRITSALPSPQTTTTEIAEILRHHDWDRVVLASHSYGSAVATWLLRDPETARMIGPLLFVDPVAFSFHAPAVPWNFLRREPRTASEWQLWYFASTDPDVVVTLTRRFDWVANSLWRDDVIRERGSDSGQSANGSWGCTVVLGGQDIITDVENLGKHLMQYNGSANETVEDSDMNWKDREWTGEGLEVVWREELNHAEAFDKALDRNMLLGILETYSKKEI
ncbi:hypothetical protein H2200_010780 [Cladophialophora chaetospira]|uniref:AB hydrolase-1 domain-containing protein n=1 Tax=Cladophialophora chaetospira TaxID=386627 RepID=A0AA38X0Q8_9EURO|nr:hypothetical protein H2200_010780 [Cladophialophora chaetospira]